MYDDESHRAVTEWREGLGGHLKPYFFYGGVIQQKREPFHKNALSTASQIRFSVIFTCIAIYPLQKPA